MDTIVITGVTGGIGSELAKEALKKQCFTIGLYRNEMKYNKLVDDIGSENCNYFKGIRIEYSNSMDLSDVFKTINQNDSEKVYLINTAFDINPLTHIENIKLSELYGNIETNVICNTFLIESFVGFSKKEGTKLSIINLDSGAGYRPIEGWSLYSASKAYINMILQTVKVENPDVDILQFDPGVVDTGMQETIRNVSKIDFSGVDEFRKYKSDNLLKAPQKVASELFEEVFGS